MNKDLIFLLFCIPARTLLAFLCKSDFKWVKFLFLLISLGFFTRYFTNPTDWWNKYRIIHSLSYLQASIALFYGCKDVAFWILIVDIILGTIFKFFR